MNYILIILTLIINCIQTVCIQYMADTSLIENNIGLLIWKTSNYWQSKLRKILSPYRISLNEYLILKSISSLTQLNLNIFQNEIGNFIGIDISVTSVTLKLLEEKKYIKREFVRDNRKKNIIITDEGINLFNVINPLLLKEEQEIFKKLNIETFNFTNSLKLLLGKKIRIKAEKE